MNIKERIETLRGILEFIESEFPSIYAQGLMLCRKGNVKRYIFEPSGRTLWVVVGKSGEYIITERTLNGEPKFFCSCPDFLFHVLFKSEITPQRRRSVCYHIVARIAAELNFLLRKAGLEYDALCIPEFFTERDSYFPDLIMEIRNAIRRYDSESYD